MIDECRVKSTLLVKKLVKNDFVTECQVYKKKSNSIDSSKICSECGQCDMKSIFSVYNIIKSIDILGLSPHSSSCLYNYLIVLSPATAGRQSLYRLMNKLIN